MLYSWIEYILPINNQIIYTQLPVLLNNSSMIILYKALLATSRVSFNVSQGSFKALSSQLAFLRVKPFNTNVVRNSPKWHVLVTTPVGVFLCNRLTPRVVQCRTRSSANQQLLLRKAQRNVSSSNVVKFNWSRLVELMLPDILLLAGAIVVSIVKESNQNHVLVFCDNVLECNCCCSYQYSNTPATW